MRYLWATTTDAQLISPMYFAPVVIPDLTVLIIAYSFYSKYGKSMIFTIEDRGNVEANSSTNAIDYGVELRETQGMLSFD